MDLKNYGKCPHFTLQKKNGKEKGFCYAGNKRQDCKFPAKIIQCTRLTVPKTKYTWLKEFVSKRLETIAVGRFGKSRELGLYFATAISRTLENEGIAIQTEKQANTRWDLQTELGDEFQIVSDAIVLDANGESQIALEIKYMEKGIFYSPDAKVIAYDFIQFRKAFPRKYFVVISGAKLAAHKDTVPLLDGYNDALFDLNLWSHDVDQKIKDGITILAMMQAGKYPLTNVRLPDNFSQISTNILGEVNESISEDLLEFSSKVKSGTKFERDAKGLLRKNNIPFAPEKPKFPCNLLEGARKPGYIDVEMDIAIPNREKPLVLVECKNMEDLGKFPKCISFDIWHLRSNPKIKNAQFQLWLGPHTKKVNTTHLRGNIEEIVYNDKLTTFVILSLKSEFKSSGLNF